MSDDQRLQLAALQLAPLLALDVGLRGLAITPDRVQGGGSDHDPREALSDAGTLRRAREVSARLAGLPRAPAGVLRWIAANAHGLGIAEASERYGRTEGPIALRDAEAVASEFVAKARRSAALAKAKVYRTQRTRAARPRGGAIVLPPAETETQAETRAVALVASAEASLCAATKALAAHGRAAILGALAVWESAGAERAA